MLQKCVPFSSTCSALGLSGFVSFFGGRICGKAYPRRIYRYALRAYLTKLTFLGGPICGGPICREEGALLRILRYLGLKCVQF